MLMEIAISRNLKGFLFVTHKVMNASKWSGLIYVVKGDMLREKNSFLVKREDNSGITE